MLNRIIVIIISCSFSLAANAQADKTYQITGIIEELPEGVEFFLIRTTAGHPDTVSRAKSYKGSFTFTGTLSLEGEIFFIKMDTSVYNPNNGRKSYVTIFLDNSIITLAGQSKAWPNVIVSGSKLTVDYNSVTESFKNYQNLGSTFGDGSKNDSVANGKATVAQKNNKNFVFVSEFVGDHPDSYVSAWLIFKLSSILSPEEVLISFDKLHPEVQASFYGNRLKEIIPLVTKRRDISVGKIIPDFTIEGTDKREVSIRAIAGQAKFTLIDFWAWWCIPCRKDVPNMKRVYNAFNKRGFNIVSISTDLDKSKWIQAIEEDKSPWFHGMDVSKASKYIFAIGSIPAYILINQKGEIVATDCGLSVFSSPGVGGSRYLIKQENDRGLRENLYEVIEKALK